jgi:hypothetical protein
LLAALAFVAGCRAGTRSPGPVVRDSAGISIVENRVDPATAGHAFRVAPLPAMDVGGDPQDTLEHFLRISRVVPLGHARLAILSSGTNSIAVFDSLGRYGHSVGRVGGGPGEYQRPRDVFRCPDDTLRVSDARKLIVFSPEGRYARTELVQRAPGDGPLVPWAPAADCSTFLWRTGSYEIPPVGRSGRIPVILFWGSLDGTARDTAGEFPSLEIATRVINGMNQPLAVPWGADLVWAVDGDRLYVASSEIPEIRVFERGSGLVRIIRWGGQKVPITTEDRRAYEEKRTRWLEVYPQLAEVMPPLREHSDLPQSRPLMRAFLVDDRQNLWVRAYPASVAGRPDRYDFGMPLWDRPGPDDSPESWTVFDPAGQLLGSVAVPGEFEVKAIRGDALIGVWKDTLDVEHVRSYRLLPGGG